MSTKHNYSKENPPQVTRNDATLSLTEATFGKTSKQKGQKFWTLAPGQPKFDQLVQFLGVDIAYKNLERFCRRVAIDLFTSEDNHDNEGHVIWDNIIEGFQSLDTGGATLSELEADMAQLIDESEALMETAEFADVKEDGTPNNPAVWQPIQDKLLDNNRQLAALKRQKKAIQEKYLAIAARRQANKEAKREVAVTK